MPTAMANFLVLSGPGDCQRVVSDIWDVFQVVAHYNVQAHAVVRKSELDFNQVGVQFDCKSLFCTINYVSDGHGLWRGALCGEGGGCTLPGSGDLSSEGVNLWRPREGVRVSDLATSVCYGGVGICLALAENGGDNYVRSIGREDEFRIFLKIGCGFLQSFIDLAPAVVSGMVNEEQGQRHFRPRVKGVCDASNFMPLLLNVSGYFEYRCALMDTPEYHPVALSASRVDGVIITSCILALQKHRAHDKSLRSHLPLGCVLAVALVMMCSAGLSLMVLVRRLSVAEVGVGAGYVIATSESRVSSSGIIPGAATLLGRGAVVGVMSTKSLTSPTGGPSCVADFEETSFAGLRFLVLLEGNLSVSGMLESSVDE
ncbi:hypothetical protein AAG570_000890 [Ranatra chinensis]|uniref:Uncharacterized protein n=1 Tax=Ranatra chinensis TaxID=642074 RepID=A0ABD0YYE9_9HEMI